MATPIMSVWICWGLQAAEQSPTGSTQLIPDHPHHPEQPAGRDGEKSFSPGNQSSSWDVALTKVVSTAFPPGRCQSSGKRGQMLGSSSSGISQLQQLRCCSMAHLPGSVLRDIPHVRPVRVKARRHQDISGGLQQHPAGSGGELQTGTEHRI